MTFTPQGTVCLCQGIPWDNTYNHTVDFANDIAQKKYFESKVVATFVNQTYQRQTAYFNAPGVVDQFQYVNYMFWVNENYSTKRYYAFVTRVEYDNPGNTRIYFEIDLMQTWMFSYQFEMCYIEREHVAQDTYGKYIYPECLETGEYIFNDEMEVDGGYKELTQFHPMLFIGVSERLEDQTEQGAYYQFKYDGLEYFFCTPDRINEAKTLVKEYSKRGKGGAIITMFMYPKELTQYISIPSASGWFNPESDLYSPSVGQFINTFAPMDGYSPKNNKCYTYPYRYFLISGAGAGSKSYKYEFFNNLKSRLFNLYSGFGGSSEIIYSPINYKKVNVNINEAGSIPPFPQCSWINDTFANWYAQNQQGINYRYFQASRDKNFGETKADLNTAYSVMDSLSNVRLSVGSIINTTSSIVKAPVENMLEKQQIQYNYNDAISMANLSINEHFILPDTVEGTSAASSYYSSGMFNIYMVPMCLRYEDIRRIDEYFSMYGYKVNELNIPQIRTRKEWNYLKLLECNINGTLPTDHKEAIKAIYIRGITIWHNPENIYKYGYDNGSV